MTEEEFKERRRGIHEKWQRKSREIALRYPDSSASMAAAPAIAAAVKREVAAVEEEYRTSVQG